MVKHFATTQIKMSKKFGDYGRKTLCNLKFHGHSGKLTTSIKWISCQTCLEGVLLKRKKEVEYLEWAVQDLNTTGIRRLKLPNEQILREYL